MNSWADACRQTAQHLAGHAAAAGAVLAVTLVLTWHGMTSAGLRPALVLCLACAALSALQAMHVAFDARLFSLMARHEDEAEAGEAVDRLLERYRLVERPDAMRSTRSRIDGAWRLVTRLHICLLAFMVTTAVAAAMPLALHL